MGLRGAEQALLFDGFFILLIGLYGVTATGTSLGSLATIPAPNIAQFPGLKNCQITDLACNAANLNTATAYIAIAIFNILGVLGFIVIEMILFLNIVLNTAFNPALSSNGIPVAGVFFVFVQLIIAWRVFDSFRGSPSGF